jgi:pectate lyase-like protein
MRPDARRSRGSLGERRRWSAHYDNAGRRRRDTIVRRNGYSRAWAAALSCSATCGVLGDGDASRASDAELSVRPESFGAHPDDGIDDTAGIQAALGSMTGGGTLTFGPGTYLHEDQVFVRTSDVRLVGNVATLHATAARASAFTSPR